MSAVGGAHEGWPNPEAFNALPGSIRAKLYSDFADAGKMTWVSHEGPLKVCVMCVFISESVSVFVQTSST